MEDGKHKDILRGSYNSTTGDERCKHFSAVKAFGGVKEGVATSQTLFLFKGVTIAIKLVPFLYSNVTEEAVRESYAM